MCSPDAESLLAKGKDAICEERVAASAESFPWTVRRIGARNQADSSDLLTSSETLSNSSRIRLINELLPCPHGPKTPMTSP